MRTFFSVFFLSYILLTINLFSAERFLIFPPQGQDPRQFALKYRIEVLEFYETALLTEKLTSGIENSGAFIKPLPQWDVVRISMPFSVIQKPSLYSIQEPGLYIFHFKGPIKDTWVNSVKNLPDTVITHYIPNFACISYVGKPVSSLSSLQGVDWVGKLNPEWRLSPYIQKAEKYVEGNAALVIANGKGVENTLQKLKEYGVKFEWPKKVTAPYFTLKVFGSRSVAEKVVSLEHIIWASPDLPKKLFDEVQDQIVAGNHNGSVPNGPGYKSWLSSVGLGDLSSVIVDVADDGWDTGNTIVGQHHPDFDNASGTQCRVIYQFDTCGDGNHGVGGHGTINQAIVMGDGDRTGMADANGYKYGTGVAPTARGGHTKVFNDSGSFCPATMVEITEPARDQGAVITSNSWGASTYGGYSADSADYDRLVRDADDNPSDGLQQFIVVFAAGNDGPSEGMVGAPGTAKNVITSGASENVRDHNQADGCGDSNANNCNDITDFSSPGPCTDGRIKPDAMAPGNHIQGAASQYSGFDGSSVCGGPSNDFNPPPDDAYWPTGQTYYTWSSGTSHSTPGMAGAAALIYKWYENQTGIPPSPAMVKAIMLGTADDMYGGEDGNGGTITHHPNIRQGWGRVNLGRMVDNASKYFYDQGHIFTSSGQSFQPMPVFTVVDPSLPVRIMMVYTDYPGVADCNPCLVNDLDLVVQMGGNTYLGNVFLNGYSTSGGAADNLNNVEAVYFPPGTTGVFTVTINATNISADAIPGNSYSTDQDFALFIYNATDQTSNGIVSLDKSLYNCSSTVNILVSDADLKGNGIQEVSIWTNTESTPETVLLIENPAGSGVFKGSISLTSSAPVHGDNLLSAAHNDTITVRYIDLNDGQGGTNVPKYDTATTDCQGPIITNVQASVSGTAATITWTTDELSNSVLYYSSNPPNWSTATSSAMTTNHSVTITGLDTCTKYYFWVQSTDSVGNTGSNNNNGSYYTFITGLMVNLIDENFEGPWGPYGNNPPAGWTIEDHGSVPGTWNENDWYKYSKGGVYGYVARVYYSPVENQDEWLITPAFNISSELTSVSLEFDHYFYEYSAEDAYVDITSDQHPTWTTLAHYDATTANMAHENISLDSYIGNTNVKIRFRYVGNNGWYWEVDNVKIVGSGICATSAGQISMDRNIYHCNNDTIWITIRDTDLSGTAQAIVTTTGGDSETVICYETGVGVFKGSINTGGLPRTVGDGILQVADSETITATYYDADDGTGNPQIVQDTAITDCKGPIITNVQIINITGTSADVVWTTDELSNSYVQYDTGIPPVQWNASDPSMVTSHIIHLTGLSPCTTYYLFVRSADTYGNTTTDNNGGSYYSFETPGEVQLNIASTDVPKAINDNSTVTSTITISENRTIIDVNVTITNITHTYDGDLDIYLISPTGTRVELSTDNGSSGDNYVNTVFDDEASTPITSGTAPFTGSFKPEGLLSALDGESAQGTWTLEVSDDAGGDTGTLNGWSITITYVQACGPYLEYQTYTFTDSCSGSGSGVGNGYIDPGEDINLQITLFNNGSQGTTGVSATISTTTGGITITDNYATFPDIPAGGTGTSQANHYSFRVGTGVTCGTEIQFNINISSNEGNWTDTFTLIVGQVVPGGTVTVFQENFNSVTVPNLPPGWTTQVISGNPWATYNSYYCSAPNQLNYPYHTTQAANSWAFTPGIQLQAGVTYTLNFNMRVASSTYPENLEVKIGTAPNAASQTILIWSQTNITNTTCQLQSPTFTVPTTGTYYIGFHCTSAPDMWRMIVDDIVLTYQQAPSCVVQPCTPAQPNIVYFSSGSPTPLDEDGDGVMEAGERWQMSVTVRNIGNAPANDVFGSLSGEGIEVCNNPGDFGDIPVSGTASYTFEFLVDPDFWYSTYPCGSSIGFDLINKSSDSGNYTYADDLNFRSQQVGIPGGVYDLFLDDFANLNNWTQNPPGSTTIQNSTHCPPHSTSYARISGASNATLTHIQSTLGYTNIHIIFDVLTTGMDAGEYLYLEWYDGSSWYSAWYGQPTSWQCGVDIALPQGASNNANFRIRFRNNASNANETGSVDYVIIRGATQANCGTWNASCPALSPKPIPDGSGTTTPVLVSKANSDGTQLIVNWDDQCATSNVNIIYGPLSGLSSYQIAGSKCDILNPDTWNIGSTTNIWFVLVTDNGAGTESSWGMSSSGQRNGTTPSGQCGNNSRDNSGTCP
ncbi:MAG: S8 family serine peptidase [Thermoanaerobaculia bacterium]